MGLQGERGRSRIDIAWKRPRRRAELFDASCGASEDFCGSRRSAGSSAQCTASYNTSSNPRLRPRRAEVKSEAPARRGGRVVAARRLVEQRPRRGGDQGARPPAAPDEAAAAAASPAATTSAGGARRAEGADGRDLRLRPARGGGGRAGGAAAAPPSSGAAGAVAKYNEQLTELRAQWRQRQSGAREEAMQRLEELRARRPPTASAHPVCSPAASAATASPAAPGSEAAAAAPAGSMVEALGQTMLAQALGSTFTKAQQLPALQASYRTAMEELARQTAANDALKAELADQKAMMERAARGGGGAPPRPRPRGGHGGGGGGGGGGVAAAARAEAAELAASCARRRRRRRACARSSAASSASGRS